MQRRWMLVLVLFAATSPATPRLHAQEAEEILSYDVSIDVGDGGVMQVVETVRVRAQGDQIRRGIYRDVPTSFPRFLGLGRIEAPFDVLSVTRNGTPEPYAVEAIGGPVGRRGMRIRIGNANVLIDHGVHEYVIAYETSRWVTFGDDTDELYWNVTGNDWAFPIRTATATVTLPGVDEPTSLEAWTGPEGSTEADATTRWNEGTATATFETTGSLGPGEGLTIGVAFPTGRLAPPSPDQRARWTRLDWGGWIDAGYVVLLVVAVYLLMWRRVGMDPPTGRPGIQAEPPKGYSPAALGYIADRGYDDSQLAAALVNMALKGAIRLEQNDDGWRLEKLAEPDALQEPLSDEETALFFELLGSRTTISLSRSNHATLRAAIKTFRAALSRRLAREYFRNNRRWFAVGLAVSLAGFAALAWRWRFDINPVALFLGFWLTGWSAGVGTMAYRLAQEFRAARRGGTAGTWAGVGFLGLFSIPFFIAEIVVAGILFVMVPFHLLAAGIVIGVVNVLFFHLLERPTLRGRGVLDGLEAFKAHIDGAATEAGHEGGPSDGAPGADRRILTYERFLPFAIALGMEERWTDAFAGVLAPALVSGPGYFDWYRGPRDEPLAPTRFATDLGQGLASRISAMSSPPSSGGSGGGGGFSSGGGSSGGGGGGGGGGGW